MHYFYNQKFKIKTSLSYLPPRIVIKTNMKDELSNSKDDPKMEFVGRGLMTPDVRFQTLATWNSRVLCEISPSTRCVLHY